MRPARIIAACTLLAIPALAACSAQSPQLQREVAAQRAVSSVLENRTDGPVTIDDGGGNPTLDPHRRVVGEEGAWMVPLGWVCTWHDARAPKTEVTVRAAHFDTWTTYTGYQQVVDTCAPIR
jgi:hypothetical protein